MNKKYYGMFIVSMLIFGTIGIFRKNIELASALIACARGLIGAACLLIAFLFKGGRKGAKPLPKTLFWIALSGVLIGINWILLFEAFNYTTVAVATLCYYMEPTIVILLSPIFFHEALTLKKGLCAFAAIVGMVFVSGIMESGLDFQLRGVLFGLGAAALYSAVVMMNKKITMDDPYEKTMLQLFAAGAVMVPYLALTGGFSNLSVDTTSLVLLLIVGVLHTGVAYLLYFGSFGGMKVQSVAILSYIDPVSALLLSAVFLHERMTLYGIIGAILIIGSALVAEMKK